MPGYTKQQLLDRGLKRSNYGWCPTCRRYWHKAGLTRHRAAGHRKLVVEFDMPPSPKPKKGDVLILHPAWERLLNFVVDAAIVPVLERQHAQRDRPKAAEAQTRAKHRQAPRTNEPEPEPEYEVITVVEAMNRFGVTREEIMAEFDEVVREHRASRRKGTRRPR